MDAGRPRPPKPPTRSRRCAPFGPVLAIKLYRITLDHPPAVPTLPCLDHEAMLHEGIAPHAAAYVQDATSGDLHELVRHPGEAADRDRHDVHLAASSRRTRASRLRAHLAQRFPGIRVRVNGAVVLARRPPGRQRLPGAGDAARRALGHRHARRSRRAIDRLFTVGMLMEKESRVASWGVRTVTGPLLAAAGFVLYGVLGVLRRRARRGRRRGAALRARGGARRGVPLLRPQGRAAHRDVEPRVEAHVRVQPDPHRAKAPGS